MGIKIFAPRRDEARPYFLVFSYSTYGVSLPELLEGATAWALNFGVNCPVSGCA